MKNTPKEELDSVEFKVSVTVYIFIIKSTVHMKMLLKCRFGPTLLLPAQTKAETI